MMASLYGDGIHDDYPAIQALLDSKIACVALPAPQKCYTISKCLKIYSNQELRLDRFTVIRLGEMANCSMLENADPENGDRNICVTGGIWDMNHRKQWPNPYHFTHGGVRKSPEEIAAEQPARDAERKKRTFSADYSGHCFRFNTVDHFIFRDVTIVNPVVYGFQMAFVTHFTIENITFDYTEGSPKLWNLDGVHIEGGCKNGFVRNLQGACHDDLLAITSYDGKIGPIENITVSGLIAEHCHSAVRLLSIGEPVRNIHISDIFGSFYVYCVIMSKYYSGVGQRGIFEHITIENVHAAFSEGTADVAGHYGPLIDIKKELDIRHLTIRNVVRDETVCFHPTVGIGADTVIHDLLIENCTQTSGGHDMAFLKNDGQLRDAQICNIFANGEKLGFGEYGM